MNRFAKNLGKAEMRLLASFWTFAVREGKCMDYEPMSRCPATLFAKNEGPDVRCHFFPILCNANGALISYWAIEQQTCLIYIHKNKTATVFASSIADFLSLLLYGNDFLEKMLYTPNHQECLSKLLQNNQTNYREFDATEKWLDDQQIVTSVQPKVLVETAKKVNPDLEGWLRKKIGGQLFPNSLN